MVRRLAFGLSVVGLSAVLAGPVRADNRLGISKKGSLLIYSKVELRWDCRHREHGCRLTQDTVLDISNDYNGFVNVQFYFVNGDPPTPELCDISCPPDPDGSCAEGCVIERAHNGWNWVDCEVPVTPNQPLYMHMIDGEPAGCQPFTELDPGDPPGRPDPEDPWGGRVLRGFVYAWAVDNDPSNGQNVEVRWNHLVGDAVLINYANSTAAEYNAYAAAVVQNVANGALLGTPGVLNLDGVEYDQAYQRLVMDFYSTIGLDDLSFFFLGALSGDRRLVINDTDITLHPVSVDVRQENEGPVRTKAVFDIWNEDERRRSGTEICVECWNQTIASQYPPPNHLLLPNLGTAKGKARIEGKQSNIAACPGAIDAAILGVQIKVMDFYRVVRPAPRGGDEQDLVRLELDGKAESAITLVGQGERNAVIEFDLVDPSEDAHGFSSGLGLGEAGTFKSSDRSGR
jgi:hypothetical protein